MTILPDPVSQETAKAAQSGWKRVSFAMDCEGGCEETGEFGLHCSICGDEYSTCPCPGPTHEGYEYREISGVLWARKQKRE